MKDDHIAEALGRYLGTTLHTSISLSDYEGMRQLPSFLDHSYKSYESKIVGRRCVFLVTRKNNATPSQIEKHLNLVQNKDGVIAIFVTFTMNPNNRNRLMMHGVPFVVPGNQLYIPQLAMDLRERFRSRTPKQGDGLSSAAPAVLFHHLLGRHHLHGRDGRVETLSVFASQLRYTKMSISRAFDALVEAGLAKTRTYGKERYIQFTSDQQQLFRSALPHLRSPVRSEKFVRLDNRPRNFDTLLKLAGESALAKMTNLSPPDNETYAVSSRDWMTVSDICKFQEVGRYEADLVIETWTYSPASLTDGQVVDPLSLYTQFHKHADPRISMATEQLLENVRW